MSPSLPLFIHKLKCRIAINCEWPTCNYFSKHMRSKKLVTELSPGKQCVKTYSHNLKKIVQVILIIQGDTDINSLL